MFSRRAILGVGALALVLGVGWGLGTIVQGAVNSHTAGVQRQFNHRIEMVLGRLTAAANGECYRVNVLRWNQDVTRYQSYQLDLRQAAESRPGSPTLKFFAHLPEVSRRTLLALAAAQRTRDLQMAHGLTFLPFTDCAQALNHPTTYVPPRPVPFGKYPRGYLHRLLAKPPPPPAHG